MVMVVLVETGPYVGEMLVTAGTVVVTVPLPTVIVVVWVLVALGRVPPSPIVSVTE